ncbi:MAG TPA: hypothetical protein VI603_00480 [Saprospiraceae bacterium]|nr:hypothetical protein [Saprospiraceae bacterium]
MKWSAIIFALYLLALACHAKPQAAGAATQHLDHLWQQFCPFIYQTSFSTAIETAYAGIQTDQPSKIAATIEVNMSNQTYRTILLGVN